jgi:hypothetical protein
MKRCGLAITLMAVILAAGPVGSAVPGQVDFQGLLLDSAGEPATGSVDLAFTLFDAPSGGTPLWSETLPDVPLADGVYSVTLGATTPITPAVLEAGTGSLYLEIVVDGETLEPRRPLVAVPFAVRAADADALGGQSSEFFTQIVQHFSFDGSEPANDDPSEGVADADGDTTPNFLDPDNDGDGIGDGVEVAQGTDINLVTPAISDTTPDPVERNAPTEVSVTGVNFEAGMAVDLEGVPLTATNLTPTSFQVEVTALIEGQNSLSVTRQNGQGASAAIAAERLIPVLASVFPPVLKVGSPTTLSAQGTDLGGDIAVDFAGDPVTPTGVTDTSFQVLVTALAVGDHVLTVTRPGGESDTFTLGAGEQRRVFASAPTSGAIGGAGGGDAACAARASALGITGTFLAWLSDAGTSPAARFVLTGGPFLRLDGTQIADDWTDLTDGTLDAPIDPPVSSGAWSNTSASGTWVGAGPDCSGWTNGSVAVTGARGFPFSAVATWTTGGTPVPCSATLPIYCFEQ